MKGTKKALVLLVLIIMTASLVMAEELPVTLEITGVKINKGSVYVAIYDSAENFKAEKTCQKFCIEPAAETLYIKTLLNEGYYRISSFQDKNGNGELNTGLFGIPSEPFAISNYPGRGIPRSFEKLKLWIGPDADKPSINLSNYKM